MDNRIHASQSAVAAHTLSDTDRGGKSVSGFNRKVALHPSTLILNSKIQLAEQTGKALSERSAEVRDAFSGWLLSRPAGGVSKNAGVTRELEQDFKAVGQRQAKVSKAISTLNSAIDKLAHLRERVGQGSATTRHSGLSQAQARLEKAEAALTQEANGLAGALNDLELKIHFSEQSSVLQGFYDATPRKLLSKQHREIQEIRRDAQQDLGDTLTLRMNQLQTRASAGDRLAQLELGRLTSQLAEVKASGPGLDSRLASDKGFHKTVRDMPQVIEAKNALKSRYQAFNTQLMAMGQARASVDQLVMQERSSASEARRPKLTRARIEAEKKYQALEQKVGQAANSIRMAEQNLASALKGSRKLGKLADKVDKQQAAARSLANLKAQRGLQQFNRTRQKSAPRFEPPRQSRAAPQATSHTAAGATVSKGNAAESRQPRTIEDSRNEIHAKLMTSSHGSGVNYAAVMENKINHARKPEELSDLKKLVTSDSEAGPKATELLLRLVDLRIMQMMRSPSFAKDCDSSFVQKTVTARHLHQRLDKIRLESAGQWLDLKRG